MIDPTRQLKVEQTVYNPRRLRPSNKCVLLNLCSVKESKYTISASGYLDLSHSQIVANWLLIVQIRMCIRALEQWNLQVA